MRRSSTAQTPSSTGSTSPGQEHVRTGIRRARKRAPTQTDRLVERAHDDTYNEWKNFEGQRYTGMRVGSHHTWYYDQGVWRERKMTPDEWTFDFAVKKRRAGKAPKGSGVPVGAEYHWYILAHQNVRKLNANVYSTALSGIKFKVAHKRAEDEKWSATEGTQKKRIIRFLEQMLADLKGRVEAEDGASRRTSRAHGTPPSDGATRTPSFAIQASASRRSSARTRS
jgi:hypothetical protein